MYDCKLENESMVLPQNLLNDTQLTTEILDRASSLLDIKGLGVASLSAVSTSEIQDYLSFAISEGPLEARETVPLEKALVLEAVILTMGRPAILIQDGSFSVPETDAWKDRLYAVRATIETSITSVGRIEVTDHPLGFSYVGTGWLVEQDIIVTNRHVAQTFSKKKNDGSFIFKSNPVSNQQIKVNIDFREEYKIATQEEFDIIEILYIEEDEDAPDIAFLRVSKQALVGGVLVNISSMPISLFGDDIQDESQVYVIGYPAEDTRRNPLSSPEINAIFGDIYDVKRLQPGQVKSVNDNIITHDCSTLGGNSGSVVIDLNSGKAIGLHFGGKFMIENYAVPAKVIKDRLSRLG
jgi:endonuclease G, mitochondrial